MTTVASIAHRALRHLPRYRSWTDDPSGCERLGVGTSGEIVGVYENPPTTAPPVVVITAKAICWRTADERHRVEYAKLRDVLSPGDKTTASEVRMILGDGDVEVLSIQGGEGKYRDMHSFVRFLLRVQELHQPSSPSQ
jgi:hypothetical protein